MSETRDPSLEELLGEAPPESIGMVVLEKASMEHQSFQKRC